MKSKYTYRINGFEQIKAFYSWVFNNADKRITPQHISLYLFLINQGNRNNWVEWFKVPYDLGMTGACIGNKKTYYSCLADLSEWRMIQYEKGINEWKAPLIRLEVLKSTSSDTATIPLPEPLPIPQVIPLPIPLPTHIYKLLTNNLKLITDNIESVLKFLEDKSDSNDENKKKDITDFWNSYHQITGLPKTDLKASQKYWDKLTEAEKQKATDNIKLYFDSLSDKKYCKKARTYLADKNFNDEFKVNGSIPEYGHPISSDLKRILANEQ